MVVTKESQNNDIENLPYFMKKGLEEIIILFVRLNCLCPTFVPHVGVCGGIRMMWKLEITQFNFKFVIENIHLLLLVLMFRATENQFF